MHQCFLFFSADQHDTVSELAWPQQERRKQIVIKEGHVNETIQVSLVYLFNCSFPQTRKNQQKKPQNKQTKGGLRKSHRSFTQQKKSSAGIKAKRRGINVIIKLHFKLD